MDNTDQMFWLAVIGAISGFLGLSLKSKCDSIECCCIKIHRNIQAELEEEKYDIEHHASSDSSKI